MSPRSIFASGCSALNSLAIGADAEADLDPTLAEMVERGDLFGQHHDVVAHRQHDYAGADLDRLGSDRTKA